MLSVGASIDVVEVLTIGVVDGSIVVVEMIGGDDDTAGGRLEFGSAGCDVLTAGTDEPALERLMLVCGIDDNSMLIEKEKTYRWSWT